MSGYLQYSNYGEDEKPFIQQQQQQQPQGNLNQQQQPQQQPQQPKRTLRTKTLRSKQPQNQQPQQPQQPQNQLPQNQLPQNQPQQLQTKYSQYIIQKLHNNDNDDSDSDSDHDVYKQFQTEPVFSNTIYAPSSGNDLNSKLNPASAKEGFATASANNASANALAPPKYPQYLSSVFQASSNNDAESKDLMLQKLDQIIFSFGKSTRWKNRSRYRGTNTVLLFGCFHHFRGGFVRPRGKIRALKK